ncbi:hypothetical protein AB870_12220 [Pandoraea faecigallinarum]|uniref:Type III secretion system protein PrgJ n=1 Tax=Pandoraea faecigallinarum TaxID=656179 RepID=A0A0H3WSV9_9BURK|nr:type III secretion system inner rod subunit SctI [Pandoraea faecigallinarum]AKM30710.1 hypothetical protein AB870_12220 [Pandoraea faecigallinarum]
MSFDPSLSSISALHKSAEPVLAADPGAGQSLESRVMTALSNMSAGFEAQRADIANAAANFDVTDAASAVELQTRLADYGIGVQYVATVARKMVGAVEALLR